MQHILKKDNQKKCTNSQYIKSHSNRHAYSSSHPYHCTVVIPYTASRRYIITPAPKKTMPDTICTATRDASTPMLSPKPYFDTTIMSALPAQTIVCVRIPTSLNLSFLSYPIANPSMTANNMLIKYCNSSTTLSIILLFDILLLLEILLSSLPLYHKKSSYVLFERY